MGPLSLGTASFSSPSFPHVHLRLSKMADAAAAPAAEFTAEQIEAAPAADAAPAPPEGFTGDQLEDFKEAFGLFDRVGDSQVAFNQVADICRALGQNPTNKEVAKILGNPTADDMANKRIVDEEDQTSRSAQLPN